MCVRRIRRLISLTPASRWGLMALPCPTLTGRLLGVRRVRKGWWPPQSPPRVRFLGGNTKITFNLLPGCVLASFHSKHVGQNVDQARHSVSAAISCACQRAALSKCGPQAAYRSTSEVGENAASSVSSQTVGSDSGSATQKFACEVIMHTNIETRHI